MLSYYLNILQHVLIILEVESMEQHIVMEKSIDSVRKILSTKYRVYQYLSDRGKSMLFVTDMDQIGIFQHCH